MSMICSTLRCWSKASDETVGTSTNCSTTCGAMSTAREGHEDEETLGTSLTCSATGKSKRRKNSNTVSITCGTGRSRICTNGQAFPTSSKKYRSTRSCQPATSDRGAIRPPGRKALPERGRVVLLVPLPLPLPSSGAVYCGAETRQGPLRPPSARDANASGGVALSGGGHSLCRRLLRRAMASQPLRFEHNLTQKGNANLFEPCGTRGGGGC